MRIIGLAGWSGAGKTTLLVRAIPALRIRGLSVSTLKQTHHSFDIDRPGKDSFRHREAGATEVLIASPYRFALMHELRGSSEPSLADHLARLAVVDIVLVEGFKQERHAKVEVHRAENGKPFLFPQDASIRALVSDAPQDLQPLLGDRPHVDFADIERIVDLILQFALPLEETLQRLAAPASTNKEIKLNSDRA
jgi:molybdopterin-guanine dinucleotide biosynthesis adapter protein